MKHWLKNHRLIKLGVVAVCLLIGGATVSLFVLDMGTAKASDPLAAYKTTTTR